MKKSKLIRSMSEDNFDQVTFESSIPALVFFGAERCKVCVDLAPLIEKIAEDYREKISTYSVNVDEQESLATRFRLRGIPTLLLFKDGEIKERVSGALSKDQLDRIIETVVFGV